MSKIKLEHVKYGVSLKDWNLETINNISEHINTAILDAAAEAIKCSIDSGDAYAYLPMSWISSDGMGGEQPSDPLSVYVQFPFGDVDKGPTFKFSLSEAVEDAIELNIRLNTGKIESKEDIEAMSKIRDQLRHLADEIDRHLASG